MVHIAINFFAFLMGIILSFIGPSSSKIGILGYALNIGTGFFILPFVIAGLVTNLASIGLYNANGGIKDTLDIKKIPVDDVSASISWQ